MPSVDLQRRVHQQHLGELPAVARAQRLGRPLVLWQPRHHPLDLRLGLLADLLAVDEAPDQPVALAAAEPLAAAEAERLEDALRPLRRLVVLGLLLRDGGLGRLERLDVDDLHDALLDHLAAQLGAASLEAVLR